jgi:hypothetical protein
MLKPQETYTIDEIELYFGVNNGEALNKLNLRSARCCMTCAHKILKIGVEYCGLHNFFAYAHDVCDNHTFANEKVE